MDRMTEKQQQNRLSHSASRSLFTTFWNLFILLKAKLSLLLLLLLRLLTCESITWLVRCAPQPSFVIHESRRWDQSSAISAKPSSSSSSTSDSFSSLLLFGLLLFLLLFWAWNWICTAAAQQCNRLAARGERSKGKTIVDVVYSEPVCRVAQGKLTNNPFLLYFWPSFLLLPNKGRAIYLFLFLYFVYDTDATAAAAETVEILLHAVKK